MRTIEWKDGRVEIIDQTRLPAEVRMVSCGDYERLARAIETMEIRGAPALGVAAAMGIALAGRSSTADTVGGLVADLERAAERIGRTRPTARNLFWGLEMMRGVWEQEAGGGTAAIREALVREARRIAEDDVARCRAIGGYGAALIEDGDGVMTHCNAGALACVEHGTALGVIRSAVQSGKGVLVYACETRPLLQGARLTAFELKSEGIPFRLITDSMSASVMQRGLVKKVVVGADRITRRGDVVNKVGTCGHAIIARRYGIPFYVAAPLSTVDLEADAADITIEERAPEEVTHMGGALIAPAGTEALNPAFDLTPSELVSAIITEKGVFTPPYDLSVLFR